MSGLDAHAESVTINFFVRNETQESEVEVLAPLPSVQQYLARSDSRLAHGTVARICAENMGSRLARGATLR